MFGAQKVEYLFCFCFYVPTLFNTSPLDSTVSEDIEIEPWAVAALAVSARRSITQLNLT